MIGWHTWKEKQNELENAGHGMDDEAFLTHVMASLPQSEQKTIWKQSNQKGKKKFDISKVKCFNCNQYGHFTKDCPKKKDQANMSREEEETSYSNESHMDLLSASEEECAMVAQDSSSPEDLDDSIVTFGQQNSEKENFEKIHYENDSSLMPLESS